MLRSARGYDVTKTPDELPPLFGHVPELHLAKNSNAYHKKRLVQTDWLRAEDSG